MDSVWHSEWATYNLIFRWESGSEFWEEAATAKGPIHCEVFLVDPICICIFNPISICIWNPFVCISISNLIWQHSQYLVKWSISTIWSISFPNSKILIWTNQLQMFSIQKVTLCFTIPGQFWLLKGFFLLTKPTFQHALQNQHLCLKHICIYVTLCVVFLFHLYILYIWIFFTFLTCIFIFVF